MTRRSHLFFAASLMTAAVLLPSSADAQGRRGPRVAARATVVVRPGYYYQPFFYDPWYPSYWYPSPYYYGGRYFDGSASVRLQVTPKEAEVFVDGYYAGIVDDFDGTFQRLNLEPGEHELQLFLAGYRPVTQRVYLQPRGTFRVRHTMEPLAPGEAEPRRPAPAAGSQTVAPAPRGQGASGRVAPRANPRSARQGDYGTLALRVQPGDSEVLIDGERWENTSGDERLVVQLAPGRHNVEIRKAGYRDFATDVNIQPGQTSPLNVSLARRE